MKAEIEMRSSSTAVLAGMDGLTRHASVFGLLVPRRPVLMLVVWILKREVRAFGGCLGMHRR